MFSFICLHWKSWHNKYKIKINEIAKTRKIVDKKKKQNKQTNGIDSILGL